MGGGGSMRVHIAISITTITIFSTLAFSNTNCRQALSPDAEGTTPLIEAAKHGDLETIKNLVEQGAKLEQGDKWGGTALILASYHGKFDAVRLLLELGANINAQVDFSAEGRGEIATAFTLSAQ